MEILLDKGVVGFQRLKGEQVPPLTFVNTRPT
jgi:hypothetical protein